MSPAAADLPTTIHTLVLSDSKESAELLVSLLAGDPGLQVRSSQMAFGEGLKAISRHEPQVVILADNFDDPAAVAEQLESASPGLPTIVVLAQGDLNGAQSCSLAGARATLFKPFDRGSLVEAIRQVHTKEVRRRLHVASSLDVGAARPQRPRVIAVHGAKGGVGATTLACNLAVSLRRLTGRRVAVVDGDVLSGDAGVMFDVTSSRSISDLLPVIRELEADLVNTLLPEHATGVRVLLAPDQLQRAEAVGGDDIQRVLSSLKPYFDYQVVDTPSLLTPVTLAALDEADLIVLVVTPEIVSLRSAARFLELASQLGYAEEKVLLVANRANAGKGINSVVIEEQLHRRVAATIGSDGRALVDSINAGELIVAARSRHRISRDVTHLSRMIAASFGWVPGKQDALAGRHYGNPATSDQGSPRSGGTDESGRRSWFPLFSGRKALRALPALFAQTK
jgi:pilus assembly protein CpaE